MNKELKTKLDEINTKFGETKVAMEKAGASREEIQRLFDARKKLEEQIRLQGDDLSKLNVGEKLKVKGGTMLGGLPQEGLPDMSKVVNLGKENMWRKGSKLLSNVPSLSKLKPTLGGIATLGLGAAASMFPEESMASEIAETGTRAIEEGDPLDFIMGGREVGRGADIISPEMIAQMKADEEERKRSGIRSMIKNPMIGGEADINPTDAMSMTGESLEPEKKQAVMDALQRLRNRK